MNKAPVPSTIKFVFHDEFNNRRVKFNTTLNGDGLEAFYEAFESCECESSECCANLVSLHGRIAELERERDEYRIKHEVACSTLELVKERRDAVQRALAAQCKHTKDLEAERDELKASRGKWIDPNDKTQTRFLPGIGQAILFSYMGKTYIGKHTGGCFKAMTPPFHIFRTWDCHWMLLPTAIAKGEKNV